MKVIFAYYGMSCTDHLNSYSKYLTTNWAKSVCDGKLQCTGYVHYSIITDPYFGCPKDFLVVAECPNGHVISDYINEPADGKYFSLKCYGK